MSKQTINIGSVANDGTGDPFRDAFDKANANFDELYVGAGGVFARSATAVPLTGTTTETALATIAVPANTAVAGSIIKITAMWSMPSSGNQKSMRVRLGASGIGGTAVFSGAGTTIANALTETTILVTATNAQTAMSRAPRGTDYLTTGAAALTAAIDMTASENIVITGQLANTGETLTLLGYVIQIIK